VDNGFGVLGNVWRFAARPLHTPYDFPIDPVGCVQRALLKTYVLQSPSYFNPPNAVAIAIARVTHHASLVDLPIVFRVLVCCVVVALIRHFSWTTVFGFGGMYGDVRRDHFTHPTSPTILHRHGRGIVVTD
jgi:hypothetical protein